MIWFLSNGSSYMNLLAYLCFLAAARSLCLLFLNQFPTCVGERDVAWANSRFLAGFGYEFFKYASLNTERVRSLKQWDFCSPSQIVPGKGYFFLTRYLSTKFSFIMVLRSYILHTWSEGPAAWHFSLAIMRFQPKCLEFCMMKNCKTLWLDDHIKIAEVLLKFQI